VEKTNVLRYHSERRYGPAILVVLTAFIVLRRWFSARKAKRRRFQFGLGTVLVTVAVVAVIVALFNAWLLVPYRAEQHAAAALTQLGGKVVLVDSAPRRLRSYVGIDMFNIDVAAIADLSHSQVTDSDLVQLQAFRHCGLINLSDTQVSNAGLTYLSTMESGPALDLSRTRVTDISVLLGLGFWNRLSHLKLAGNRIARGEREDPRWTALLDLDLSDSDADDGTLEALDGLVNLSSLDLSGTNVTDDGLLTLLRMEGLVKLNLTDTKVTPAGVARLKAPWRFSWPLTIITGTRKKAAGAPKNASPQGTSGVSAQSIPVPPN
jgi:hypothetical protein